MQPQEVFVSFVVKTATIFTGLHHHCNWLYAQLHYLMNFSQLLVSYLPLLDKLINPSVSDLSSHNNNIQAHLN